MMDEQFKYELDRFGGNLDRWPPDLADAARRLLAVSPAAQALMDEMALIERTLSESEEPPPPGLAGRIFAAAFGADGDAENSKGLTAPPL